MIVVKIGGSVACKDLSKAVADLAKFADRAVAVHGGGCMVNDLMKKMGLQPKFLTHPGGVVSRYTDWETLQVFVMAMSWINKQIVASLTALGVEAVGLTGADGAVVRAKRKEKVIVVDERGRQRVVDGGYVGRITEVDVKKLAPPPLKVLAPIAVSERGTVKRRRRPAGLRGGCAHGRGEAHHPQRRRRLAYRRQGGAPPHSRRG